MSDLFGYDTWEGMSRSAGLSDCGLYRYWLRRSWKRGGNGKVVCFVMLNPSTADALIDDPTIKKCIGFMKAWGYSVLDVRNLFAFRATDPGGLRGVDDPVGPSNNIELSVAKGADLVIAAWGCGGDFRGRDQQVLRLLAGKDLYCLKVTKNGHPQHPLYVKGDTKPQPFRLRPLAAGGELPPTKREFQCGL